MTQEPMGLPRGTVRAALTLLLVLGSLATMFVPVVDDRAMGMLLATTAMAVNSYFQTRKAQNDDDGPVLPPPSDGTGG